MKVQDKLNEIKALVDAARTLPMSSSIVINKAELLRLLGELDQLLPDDLALAEAVLSRRDAMLYEATANAERLLTAAMEERQRMISEEEVLREARIEADEVIRAAEERFERTSREIDEYIDAKLAHLEVSVTNILETVRQGRQRLAEPGLYGELASPEDGEAEPAPLPRRPTAVHETPLLASRTTGRSSASAWNGPAQWGGPTPERDALPRRGLALEGEDERGEQARSGGENGQDRQDAPDGPDGPDTPDGDAASEQLGRHAGRAGSAGHAETRETSVAAEPVGGWTPRRPENVQEPHAGESEDTDRSAGAAAVEMQQSAEDAPEATGEGSGDDATKPPGEQGEPAPDSRPEETRTE